MGPGSYRSRGAFFTPPEIATFVASHLGHELGRVLEPACGTGDLIAAVLGRPGLRVEGITGVEIDAVTARRARTRFGSEPLVEIIEADFIESCGSQNYDTILANPPFIRHHSFTSEQRTRFASLKKTFPPVGLTGRASMWAYFLLKSLHLLKMGGRMAFILPVEYNFADYASGMRDLLDASFASVTIIPLRGAVYGDAQVSTVLLVAEGFKGITLGTWKPTPTTGAVDGFCVLNQWGTITIGTVTGANGYFLLSQDQVSRLKLVSADLLRVVPPRRQMSKGVSTYGADQWRYDRDAGARVYLWNPVLPLRESSDAYAQSGVDQGISSRYKPRSRASWMNVTPLVKGDLLLPYISGSAPMLIHNSLALPHVNSMHAIRLKPELVSYAGASALSSANSVTARSMEEQGRYYGAGGLKLELRGSRQVLVPDLNAVREFANQVRLDPGGLFGASQSVLRAYVDEILLGSVMGWSKQRIQAVQDDLQEYKTARLRRNERVSAKSSYAL